MDQRTPQPPEAIVADKKRPFTGAEFLQSLRDGREVYIYGERVRDVTVHPAFRNAAASVAKLYDALHDEKTKAVLTGRTRCPRNRRPSTGVPPLSVTATARCRPPATGAKVVLAVQPRAALAAAFFKVVLYSRPS